MMRLTSELQQERSLYQVTSQPNNIDKIKTEFTRGHKAFHDTNRMNPFTDGGSRAFRVPFSRNDYIIQDPYTGAMGKRGNQPRLRVFETDNT